MLSYQYYSLALFSPRCQLHQLLILVIYLQRNNGHAFLGMNDQDQSLPETGGGDSFRGGDHGAPSIICPGAENLLIRSGEFQFVCSTFRFINSNCADRYCVCMYNVFLETVQSQMFIIK